MAETPQTTVSTEDLAKEYAALKSQRSLVERQWDDIERFYNPLGSGMRPQIKGLGESSVEWQRSQEPWDSTAIDASEKLAASIHGSITSPAIRWYKLKWREKDLADDRESADWLDKAGDRSFRALSDSDFNTEIASADSDLVRYANCFVVEEPANEGEWKGLDFECVMVRDGYPRLDSRGMVERFFRAMRLTPAQARDLLIKHEWAVPAELEEQAKQPDQEGKAQEYVFCVFKREAQTRALGHKHERNRERMRARMARGQYEKRMQMRPGSLPEAMQEPDAKAKEPDEVTYPLAPGLRPVGGVYFCAGTGERLGQEVGYYDMPVFFARWAKTPGSVWGHGPCNVMLATVKTLNAIVEAEYEALARMVNPPVNVRERGIIGDLHLEPGGVNVTRNPDDIKPWDNHARLDASGDRANLMRQQIRHALHDDELTLKDSPAMTAQEVLTRYELMNRVLGSTLARIENDLLSPIVKTTLGYLFRAAQLPPLPPKLKEHYANRPPEFDVEYLGPLARSQRTDEVAAIERGLAEGAAVVKMGYPLKIVNAIIDIPQSLREIFQLLGTPARLLKPVEEAQKLLAEMDAADKRATEAQQQQQEGAARLAHAQANVAQAQATAAPPGGPVQSVPASPVPVVSPAMGVA